MLSTISIYVHYLNTFHFLKIHKNMPLPFFCRKGKERFLEGLTNMLVITLPRQQGSIGSGKEKSVLYVSCKQNEVEQWVYTAPYFLT
jgi:hypothetical protein